MKKLELETAAKKLELKLANRTASETPKTPGSAVKMQKMEKTHSSKDISLTSLDGVSVKIEPGTEGFLKGPRDDVESIDSGSDDGEWTEVKSKARKAKGSSVFTTGEQSDWVRTKFALMIPMDSLGVMSWTEQLKVGRDKWTNRDYLQKRTKYRSRDREFYKVLIESASSLQKDSKKEREESTMSKAARSKMNDGSIPWGHGALLFLYFEDLFENIKKTDPNYANAACAQFRRAKMTSDQSPAEWQEHLKTLRNECGGQIDESEFVNRFVMKTTKEYSSFREKFATLDEGDIWDQPKAYSNMTRYWNIMVRGKHDKKGKKKEKEQASKQALQQDLFVAAVNAGVFCDWCGKPGHMKDACTEENPQRWCSHCKSNTHWPHRCFKLKGGGKGRGRGGRGRGRGGGKGGKGKGGKGKTYQQRHFQAEYEVPAPAPGPAPSPAPAKTSQPVSVSSSCTKAESDDDSYEYDGWQMNMLDLVREGESSDDDSRPDLCSVSSDSDSDSESVGDGSDDSDSESVGDKIDEFDDELYLRSLTRELLEDLLSPDSDPEDYLPEKFLWTYVPKNPVKTGRGVKECLSFNAEHGLERDCSHVREKVGRQNAPRAQTPTGKEGGSAHLTAAQAESADKAGNVACSYAAGRRGKAEVKCISATITESEIDEYGHEEHDLDYTLGEDGPRAPKETFTRFVPAPKVTEEELREELRQSLLRNAPSLKETADVDLLKQFFDAAKMDEFDDQRFDIQEGMLQTWMTSTETEPGDTKLLGCDSKQPALFKIKSRKNDVPDRLVHYTETQAYFNRRAKWKMRHPTTQLLVFDDHEPIIENEQAASHAPPQFAYALQEQKGVRMLHDSGCTHHAVDLDSELARYVYDFQSETSKYTCGGDSAVPIVGSGKLPMRGYPKGYCVVKLTRGMGRNVFSATQAAMDGMEFHLSRNQIDQSLQARMTSKNGPSFWLSEERPGGLLYFEVSFDRKGPSLGTTATLEWYLAKNVEPKLEAERRSVLWHNRLGHEGDEAIDSLVKAGHEGIFFNKKLKRKCVVENLSAQTVSGPTSKAPEPKELAPYTHFCMDLVDSTVESIRGYKYALTIVEMSKRFKYVKLLKKKSHTVKAAEEFFDTVISKYSVKIERVRPDRGGEFMSAKMMHLFRTKYGAKYTPSQTEKPWMNGVAEHAEKDIQRRARAMLKYAGLPKEYWCYALQHSCYLSNLLPHSKLGGKSPQHARDGKVFDYSHLRVWGCPAFVARRSREREDKWDDRSEEGIYVGYHIDNNTHIVRMPDGSHKDTTDVEFNEMFEPTFRPKGLMTTRASYLNRKADGRPRLLHQATDEWYETPSESSDSEIVRAPVTFEVTSPLEKRKQVSVRISAAVAEKGEGSDSVPENNPPEINVDGDEDEGSDSVPENNPSEINAASEKFSGPKTTSENVELAKQKDPTSKKMTPAVRAKRNERRGAISQRTRSGRIARAPKRSDEPESPASRLDDWNRRKKTDRKFRDEVDFGGKPASAVQEEHALFCEANKYYKAWFEKATDPVTEYMFSAATRPSHAKPGSVESKILSVNDPKSQKTIDAMDEWNQKRFNDATTKEKENFFADPTVAQRVRITDVPEGEILLNTLCVWVTKFQHGLYEKTKARIVVRGDQQPDKGENTFAPTVRFTSMLTLFCLAAMFGWRVDKIDFSAAFLNSTLLKPVYARFPPGLAEYDADGTELVICFHKAAYGLSVAPRLWNQFQDKEYRDLGYYQHKSDSCVYSQSFETPSSPTLNKIIGSSGNGKASTSFNPRDFGILANHVDDGAFFTPSESVATREKKRFFRKYPGTDEGLLENFCGVRVHQHARGIDLDQTAYIETLADEYQCADCAPVRSPIETAISQADCPEICEPGVQKKYWKICGQLMYVCTHTRPDISYAMNQLSRVAHRPHRLHLAQAHHLLRYLVTTKNHKMKFHRATKVELAGYNYLDPSKFMDGYADSSFADCKETSKSSAGHAFFLGKHQACVEAIAKMLPHVGNSSTENEYVTLSRAAQSGFYVKLFLDELGIFARPIRFKIYEDNQAALNALKKNVAQSKFRHLRTRWHYLRDMIRDKDVEVRKIHTDDQIADFFTKPIFGEKLQKFTAQLLGHAPRDHDVGEKLDMDYQPDLIEEKQEPHIKKSYVKILQQIPP